MLGYGLNISDDDFETIVTYLGSTPDAAGDAGAGPAIDVAAASALVTSSCSTCHDLTGIEPGLYSEDDWSETVSRMLGYGLNISDEQFETIVSYLGSTPDAAGDAGAGPAIDVAAASALVTSSCSTCHDLTGIEPGLYSEDDWSETVSRMLGYGLNISDEQFETIVSYLGSTPGAAGDAGAGPANDVAAGEDDGFDADAAEALLNGSCTVCHDLTGITSAPGAYSEAEFRETIERMLGYGLSMSDSDIDMLVRFLTETYGAQ
jgi:mono/diheme cytochrome c family protein